MAPFWKKKDKDGNPRVSDRRRVRQEVAQRLGGRFEQGKRDLADKVAVEHGPWTLRLDTHVVSTGSVTVTYTRVRALARARSDLKLLVRPRHMLDRVAEVFGFRGMRSGDRRFTQQYVARGKPVQLMRSLMASGLPADILTQPAVRLEVKRASYKERKRLGRDSLALTVQVVGVIADADRILGLFRVATRALDELERIGVVELESVDGAA